MERAQRQSAYNQELKVQMAHDSEKRRHQVLFGGG